MMKSSELLVIVDSVEEAIKFYTEKLAFDIADLQASKENSNTLTSAHLRKGKCIVIFKTPSVEELAEFSFIKRCASRCVGMHVEMKKGLDKYFQRCQKKGVKVLNEPKSMSDGTRSFVIRDPFGIKIVFAQQEGHKKASTDFAGMQIELGKRKEVDSVNDMVEHLKHFSILRRAAKKYAKLKLKQLAGKSK